MWHVMFESEKNATAPGQFIGMDEAGYGPNLGPLTIASTLWETPSNPHSCDFAALLKEVLDTQSTCKKTKLHIADSKLVNTGKNGFLSLETSALTLLNLTGVETSSIRKILKQVCQSPTMSAESLDEIPWFKQDLSLPVEVEFNMVETMTKRLQQCMEKNDVHCRQIQVQLIPANQFNQLLDQFGSKGVVLSTLAFELLSHIWSPDSQAETLFVGDKHGGRNRYDEFLAQIVDDSMIFRLEEGRPVSRYRVNSTEIRFQAKGESHLPVAAASIIAKYLREVTMIQFNTFWNQHCPNVKPTKGYPVDAKRFHTAIQKSQAKLNIKDDQLWRKR